MVKMSPSDPHAPPVTRRVPVQFADMTWTNHESAEYMNNDGGCCVHSIAQNSACVCA